MRASGLELKADHGARGLELKPLNVKYALHLSRNGGKFPTRKPHTLDNHAQASNHGGKAKEMPDKAGGGSGGGKVSVAGGGPPSPTPAKSALGRPTTPIKPKTVDETWKRTCGRMLMRLWKQKEVWPFCEPVDYVKEGIPTYPDIINYPMDLGTVKLKLSNGTYTSAEAFADDVSSQTLKFLAPAHMVFCQDWSTTEFAISQKHPQPATMAPHRPQFHKPQTLRGPLHKLGPEP